MRKILRASQMGRTTLCVLVRNERWTLCGRLRQFPLCRLTHRIALKEYAVWGDAKGGDCG